MSPHEPQFTISIPSWLPLTALMVYRFGNNLGLGPLPWLINGEMFSEEAKGVSSSIVAVTHWTSVFFVTRYATNLQVRNEDHLEMATLLLCDCMSLVSYIDSFCAKCRRPSAPPARTSSLPPSRP